MQNNTFRAAPLTDVGRQRQINEDAFICKPEKGIFAVIDGMGGHAGGDVAAAEAREAISRRLEQRTGSPEVRLREAVTTANNNIYRLSQENPDLSGMGCVLTVAIIEEGRVYAAHVGDTRLYKIRSDQIKKLTHDHSAGEGSNIVLRDVGAQLHEPHDEEFIDFVETDFEPDCALLMCTDGLTDPGGPERDYELLRLVNKYAGKPKKTAKALIDLANAGGGADNITVVVVEGPAFGQAETPRVEPAAEYDGVDTVDTGALAPVRQIPAPDDEAVRHENGLTKPHSPWWYFFLGSITTLTVLGLAYLVWSRWLAEPVTEYSGASSSPTQLDTLLVSPTEREVPISITMLLEQASPGDTVFVPPGIYAETIRLRDGVALISEQPGAARIVPPATMAPEDTIAVWAEGITGATLEGFTIGSDTPNEEAGAFTVGVLVRNAGIRINDVIVTGTEQAGIQIQSGEGGTPNVVILNSVLQDNTGAGLIIDGGDEHIQIVGNEIRSNGLQTGSAGIVIRGGADPELRDNVFAENGGAGIEVRLEPDARVSRFREANTFRTGEAANLRGAVRVVYSEDEHH